MTMMLVERVEEGERYRIRGKMNAISISHLDSHRVAEEIFLFCSILLALLEKKLNDTVKQNAPHGVSGVMFALSSWLPPLSSLLSPFLRILALRFCISSTLHKFL